MTFLFFLCFFTTIFLTLYLMFPQAKKLLVAGSKCLRAFYRHETGQYREYEDQVIAHERCFGCEHRVNDTCGLCGCILAEKIPLKTEECPDGRW